MSHSLESQCNIYFQLISSLHGLHEQLNKGTLFGNALTNAEAVHLFIGFQIETMFLMAHHHWMTTQILSRAVLLF